VKKGLIP